LKRGFADRVPKSGKNARGRTDFATTPVAIRSRVDLPKGTEDWIRAQFASKISRLATLVERATVRFEDLNGPRGGVDTLCRIKVVISSRPSVQVEERAASARVAFTQAFQVLVRSLERERKKHGLRGNARMKSGRATASPKQVDAGNGEIIGRRVGRGSAALDEALARPEKARRDAYVDTAKPGVAASDRKAGGQMTARRNTLAKTDRATATLEDSRTTPSRKSTRRSANRGKTSQGKERTAVSQSVTPSARAARATAQRR
jgi:hypothetical protein